MKEYLTEAIVLSAKPSRERDLVVDLYARDLGRLRARAIGGQRLLSKFSPHLGVLNLVTVRLARKNNFILTDVMSRKAFKGLKGDPKSFARALELAFMINFLVPQHSPDLHFWYFLNRSFDRAQISLPRFLKILGYDVSGARCEICGSGRVAYFFMGDQSFLCGECFVKFPKNEIISLS